MYEFSQNFTVQFSDINENTELTNHGFLRFMQETASVHSDIAGYSIRTAKDIGISWVLLNWNLKVFSRPKWNEKIAVTTWVRSVDKHFTYRDFEVLDENNFKLAVASSKWTMVNTNTHLLELLDKKIISKYPISTKASAFIEEPINKIREPIEFDKCINYTVQKRDLDANHHVNNLSYLDFAYEILPTNDFNNIEINYKKEATLNDELTICSKEIAEKKYIVTVTEKAENKTNVIIKLY